jgi:protein SCO1/2
MAVGLLHRMQVTAPSRSGSPPLAGARIDPAFSELVDAAGVPAKESDFDGRYRLVLFGFMSCPDVCPTALAGVHLALEELGPRAAVVRPVFVTLDPARDAGAELGAYLRAFDSRIVGYRGADAATALVAQRYGVRYARRITDASTGAYVVDHTANLYLVDPAGRLVAVIPSARGSRSLAAALVSALAAEPRLAVRPADPLAVAGPG